MVATTDTAPRPTEAGYARLHAKVVRLQAIRNALGVDLRTVGDIVRAVDSSNGNIEAGARVLEPLYDHLTPAVRRLIADTIGEALRNARP